MLILNLLTVILVTSGAHSEWVETSLTNLSKTTPIPLKEFTSTVEGTSDLDNILTSPGSLEDGFGVTETGRANTSPKRTTPSVRKTTVKRVNGTTTSTTKKYITVRTTPSPSSSGGVIAVNITKSVVSTTQASVDLKKSASSVVDTVLKINNTMQDKAREDFYQIQKFGRPDPKLDTIKKVPAPIPLPSGATSALTKPTKYHYYPHNQHIYLLPECAIQQVCNAVYVRLNFTQPLCACPSRYRDPCSASLNADDLHTTRLTANPLKKKAVTLVKTCEATTEMRECRAPKDWSLLALQNVRTGKSHYLVICRCPEEGKLEGPMSHDQPTYASVPGIRVYGMMCVKSISVRRPVQQQGTYAGSNAGGFGGYPNFASGYKSLSRSARPLRFRRGINDPPFPWDKVRELENSVLWD